MGWSCTRDASDTMNAWTRACVGQTGSQNTYQEFDGERRYFWETSRVEHNDGRITGSVFVMLPDDMARKVGRFRINADGSVGKWPTAFKRFWDMEGAFLARQS
jgi:hypothetical protein